MSSKEYMGWIEYFKIRPYGWREDHRTAILTQTTYQGKTKLKINDLFPSLKQLENYAKQQDVYIRNNPFIKKLESIAAKNKIDWLGQKNSNKKKD